MRPVAEEAGRTGDGPVSATADVAKVPIVVPIILIESRQKTVRRVVRVEHEGGLRASRGRIRPELDGDFIAHADVLEVRHLDVLVGATEESEPSAARRTGAAHARATSKARPRRRRKQAGRFFINIMGRTGVDLGRAQVKQNALPQFSSPGATAVAAKRRVSGYFFLNKSPRPEAPFFKASVAAPPSLPGFSAAALATASLSALMTSWVNSAGVMPSGPCPRLLRRISGMTTGALPKPVAPKCTLAPVMTNSSTCNFLPAPEDFCPWAGRQVSFRPQAGSRRCSRCRGSCRGCFP